MVRNKDSSTLSAGTFVGHVHSSGSQLKTISFPPAPTHAKDLLIRPHSLQKKSKAMLGLFKDDLVEEHNHPPLPEDVSHVELLSLVEHKTWSHEIVWHVLHDYHPEWLSQIPAGGEETPLHALVRTGNVRLLKMLLADVRDEAESVGEETGDYGEALEAKTVATIQTNLLKTSTGIKHPRKACLAIDLNALDRAGRRVKDLPREPNFSKEYPE